jgi:hypothetical protein
MTLEQYRQLEKRYFRPLQFFAWSAIGGVTMASSALFTVPATDDLLPPAAIQPVLRTAEEQRESAEHIKMPKEVRGFYMTSFSAASPKIRADLAAYAKRNDLNAVVIDIKDFGGDLAFTPKRESLKSHAPEKTTIPDLDEVLKEMKEAGLYRIARLFVFQDPEYARRNPGEAVLSSATGKVWTDYKGISWVDPASKQAWRYNLEVALEAFERGFDEIQLDYIRFPSDGTLSTIEYARWDGKTPKHKVIGDFYAFMHRELARKNVPLSLDLFGYVTWYRDFDLGIGQLLVDALPNSEAISAMVYPSHYTSGALGFANPADHPYEIVAASLQKANGLVADHKKSCDGGAAEFVISGTGTSKIVMPCGVPLAGQRPWLQAFDIGAVYTPELINAQIKAVRDQGGTGFLLWNARNVYRDFR